MKKIIYSIIAGLGLVSIASCSGMLDTDGASDSSRIVVDPELNQKSDSVSFAYGVMEAMQQLADQYFLQNEMRGDLSAPTSKATTHLRELASFSVSEENKYDSVYLYYKVINNCNYYLAHRDTALYTGSDNVVINEYVAIAAYRAWAYLQLTTQYGDVPYVTEPVSTVSQINAQTANTDKMAILASQADYLQALKNRCSEDQIQVPTYRDKSFSIGRLNWDKNLNRMLLVSKCFIPLNVVLGDLYLELGRYEEAAVCYYHYLRYLAKGGITNIKNNYSNTRQPQDGYTYEWPIPNTNTDITLTNGQAKWDEIFTTYSEVVSVIPSAVNYLRGHISELPGLFGYDFYGTTGNRISQYRLTGCPQTTEIQIAPSATYKEMSEKAPYYYITKNQKIYNGDPSDPTTGTKVYVGDKTNIGDGRANMISAGRTAATSSCVYVQKPGDGFVYIYRLSTVYLRLAEALNRAGYPDLAFYILKTGFGSNDIGKYLARRYRAGVSPFPENYYFISEKSYKFLHESNVSLLVEADSVYFLNTAGKDLVGIHFHGAGAVDDGATWMSAYNYKDVVEERIEKIRGDFGLPSGATYSEEEYINAVEDLLCDEYAMEFAFEGTRFSDLLRIARHKNMAGSFGGTFGDTWLSKKLEKNAAGITTQNCYLPFR